MRGRKNEQEVTEETEDIAGGMNAPSPGCLRQPPPPKGGGMLNTDRARAQAVAVRQVGDRVYRVGANMATQSQCVNERCHRLSVSGCRARRKLVSRWALARRRFISARKTERTSLVHPTQ